MNAQLAKLLANTKRGKWFRDELQRSESRKGRPLTTQAMYFWAKNGGVPPARVPAVARILGVSMHSVRPDLYPPNRRNGR
jgi:hypothetical protein